MMECVCDDISEPVNVPAPSRSILTATSVPVSLLSEGGWHMDAGTCYIFMFTDARLKMILVDYWDLLLDF